MIGGIRKIRVKLINLHIIAGMAQIIIDTDKWTTQQDKAKHYVKTGKYGGIGVSIQYINKLIKDGKLESYKIPEIGLVLVEK